VITSETRNKWRKKEVDNIKFTILIQKCRFFFSIRRELPLLSPSSLLISDTGTEVLLLSSSANLLNP